jgi:hypothetical protein
VAAAPMAAHRAAEPRAPLQRTDKAHSPHSPCASGCNRAGAQHTAFATPGCSFRGTGLFACTFVSGTRKGLFALGLCLFVCSRDTRAQRTGLFVRLPVTAYSAMTVQRQRARLAEPGAHDRHSGARRRSCADTCATATSRARTSAGTHGRSCGAPLRGAVARVSTGGIAARRGAGKAVWNGMGYIGERGSSRTAVRKARACMHGRAQMRCASTGPQAHAPSALPPPALRTVCSACERARASAARGIMYGYSCAADGCIAREDAHSMTAIDAARSRGSVFRQA